MLNHFWKIVKHTTNFDLWLPVKQVFGAVFLAKHEKCQLTQSKTTMGEAFLPSTNMERQIAKVSRSCHHGVLVKCASWNGGKGWTCQWKMIQFEIVLAKKSWKMWNYPFASFFCRAGCPQYSTDHAELEPQLRLENCWHLTLSWVQVFKGLQVSNEKTSLYILYIGVIIKLCKDLY